jgi:bifunctional UDP-N-acetylglucosamine pyrophosphorylase / glucosamine-1-phosphate N-acetyltransferase
MPRRPHILVLAAGKGTRMKSARPKVLHRVAGVHMINWVLRTTAELEPETITVVVGHQAELVKGALASHGNVRFVVQEPQLGTGHALLMAEDTLRQARGTLILLSGDVPLLTASTVRELLRRHEQACAAMTVVTAMVEDATGYGRIVRSGQGIARIVEERDASGSEREIREINAGIYAFNLDGLFEAVRAVAADNAQREYYLPDLVGIYTRQGAAVETMTVARVEEILGINSRAELAAVSRIVRQAKNAELMAAGVTIEDPATTYIDRDVEIGADTVIHPGVSLEGATVIGAGCEIHSGARIVDSRLGDGATVLNHCVLNNATLASGATVGPFAHLRPGATLRAGAKVGNFVEVKATTIGEGSKAMHLAYLGDATIGANVNIGAGTITCNYDGEKKHHTTIDEGAFIGSDTQLVAPVTVGKGAYVGTGATIRENVPPGALAVSAGKQRNLEGWVEKKKQRKLTIDK